MRKIKADILCWLLDWYRDRYDRLTAKRKKIAEKYCAVFIALEKYEDLF